jgi:molybdopterin-guanine dinucleotide biosynthesis protein A
MGTPKALVELAGRPLISYPLDAVAEAELEPIVVAKPDSQLPPLECRIVHEPAEPVHPLSGILAALAAADGRPVIALGCDMPLVPPALLAWLATIDAAAAVPELAGRVQPLLARYEPRVAASLEEALSSDASATDAVLALDPRILGEGELAPYGDPATISFNVNTPADLDRAATLLD